MKPEGDALFAFFAKGGVFFAIGVGIPIIKRA
jgi:hypothetical protein